MGKILLIFLFLMHSSFAVNDEKLKKDHRPKVFTETLIKQKIRRHVTYLGKLAPTIVSKIYSPIEGVVQQLLVRPGQKVKKGQIMAILMQNLIGHQVLPLKIRAPIAGTVYRPKINQNALVQRNEHLFTIFGEKQYKINYHLSPEDANEVTLDDPVTIIINNMQYRGRIYSLAAELDLDTGTRPLEIYLPANIQKLRPGIIAKAKFEFNKHAGFLIPKNYVQQRGNKNILRLLGEDNKVKELEVKITNRIKNQIEIEADHLVEKVNLIVKSSVEPLLKGTEVLVIERPVEKKQETKN